MSPGQNHAWLLPGHLRPPDANSPVTSNHISTPNSSNAQTTLGPSPAPVPASAHAPTSNPSQPTNAIATASATNAAATAEPFATPIQPSAQHPNPPSASPIGATALGFGNSSNPTINGIPPRTLTAATAVADALASAAAIGARFRAPGAVPAPSTLINGHSTATSHAAGGAQQSNNMSVTDDNASSARNAAEDDPRIALFRERYAHTEARINALFTNEARKSFLCPSREKEGDKKVLLLEDVTEERNVATGFSSSSSADNKSHDDDTATSSANATENPPASKAAAAAAAGASESQPPSQPQPKATRKLDDDDYDEFDDDEDENENEDQPAAPIAPPAPSAETTTQQTSSTSTTSSTIPIIPLTTTTPLTPAPTITSNPQQQQHSATQKEQPKKESAEDVRKKLEQDKLNMEESVKRSFHTMFFTLEDDRDAMLDQQKLEETERQIEAEMFAQGANAQHGGSNAQGQSSGGPSNGGPNQSGRPGEIGSGYGPLSNVNLGSSSLALKNLIERIDMKRSEVMASDAELRNLMSEVRKNRSKWASEEKIGQEELYEPAEKVLNMLKAETTHSAPFLTRVNKREAPDYYNVITHPMDLGTMTKKLKNMVYKSKVEFVDDLNLIWANCLKYNTNPDHPLRKHALYMRKVSAELEPMIPDVVVRDRAEVEAEERRLQMAELDGGEESDDEPIMTSRGRKAVGKGARKGKGVGARATTTSRAVTAEESQTPAPTTQKDDTQNQNQNLNRPPSTAPTGSDFQSEAQGTPPPGFLTPAGMSNGGQNMNDNMEGVEMDSYGAMAIAAASNFSRPIIDYENPEYKMWKQVTQKGRAKVTAERHRLFKGDKLNSDEPALLRTKSGMRRWLRGKMEGVGDVAEGLNSTAVSGTNNFNRPATTNSLAQNAPTTTGETLAENMDQEENRVLPDYYDVMSAVPDIPEQLRWVEDSEGNIVDMCEEYLCMLPKGVFTQPPSKFAKKLDANMRQMQETRKICSKVSIVKQMQVQSQMYQNQFQKYNPEPFVEQDVPPHVMNHTGPVISPWVARAALQRSVGKICYSVGFEEFQPSALDAITDIAADFFQRLGGTFKTYLEVPRISTAEDNLKTVDPDAEEDVAAKPTTAPEPEKFKRELKGEHIIRHTLNAVGLDPETLESYVKEDIDRVGTKLGQLHERLKLHLADLLRPGLQDTSGDGSAMFNDGSEQFIGGDFAEDIDEDFFGFKELGLDREFGLASLTVPLHLLQNRMYNAHRSQNPAASMHAAVAFPTPPKFPPITVESVSKQIGLVQKFLLAKLKKNDNKPLVEDMDLPPKQRPNPARPRLPATGKIAPIILPAVKSDATASPAKRPAPSSKKDLASPVKKKTKKGSAANSTEKKDNADAGKKD